MPSQDGNVDEKWPHCPGALTSYSYRLAHQHQQRLLAALDRAMVAAGLVEGADFDLDLHAIMHFGEDVALDKHYVPRRSQRTRSVLSFFAQDHAAAPLPAHQRRDPEPG